MATVAHTRLTCGHTSRSPHPPLVHSSRASNILRVPCQRQFPPLTALAHPASVHVAPPPTRRPPQPPCQSTRFSSQPKSLRGLLHSTPLLPHIPVQQSPSFEPSTTLTSPFLRPCAPSPSSPPSSSSRTSIRASALPAAIASSLQPIADAFLVSPATWQSALTVTATVFAVGLPGLLSGLTLLGVASAFLLGAVVWRAFYWPGFLTVCLYFICGTLVTKVKLQQKQREGIAEQRSGRRGPWSVLGSAAAGFLCCLGAMGGSGDAVQGVAAWLAAVPVSVWQLGFVASFATKLGDTTSSEIGKAFGRSTFLVTTLQPVPRGTEGAISLEGTVAGLMAASLLSCVAAITGQVSFLGALLCIVSSQLANFAESYLGATLQDRPGYEWLTNDIVNVLNISAGAILAMAMGLLFLN